MRVLPTGKRILVRPDEAPVTNVTDGRMILPAQSVAPPQIGEVIAAGPRASDLHGKRVIYSRLGGLKMRLNEEVLLMMDADTVFGVMRDDVT